MEGQEAICGVAIETSCPSIEIKDIPAIDFQLSFMDALANILKLSQVPNITPVLFEAIESVSEQAVIIPTDINNLHQLIQQRIFTIRIEIYSNEPVIETAYGKVLAIVKVTINALNVLNKRFGLTYLARLGIINSGQATLFLTLTKTV